MKQMHQHVVKTDAPTGRQNNCTTIAPAPTDRPASVHIARARLGAQYRWPSPVAVAAALKHLYLHLFHENRKHTNTLGTYA
eukprot:1155430-Pelagomonas_calceolata.AAC.2